jgi:hypothetical protein
MRVEHEYNRGGWAQAKRLTGSYAFA